MSESIPSSDTQPAVQRQFSFSIHTGINPATGKRCAPFMARSVRVTAETLVQAKQKLFTGNGEFIDPSSATASTARPERKGNDE